MGLSNTSAFNHVDGILFLLKVLDVYKTTDRGDNVLKDAKNRDSGDTTDQKDSSARSIDPVGI